MRVISDDAFAACTIKAEAGGEIYQGQVAVGEVIRERQRTGFFSDGTVIGTCLRAKQFSVYNQDPQDNLLAIRTLESDDSDPVYQSCLKAWVESAMSSNAPECVEYYAPAVVIPYWLGDFIPVVKIGHHIFLKRKVATE